MDVCGESCSALGASALYVTAALVCHTLTHRCKYSKRSTAPRRSDLVGGVASTRVASPGAGVDVTVLDASLPVRVADLRAPLHTELGQGVPRLGTHHLLARTGAHARPKRSLVQHARSRSLERPVGWRAAGCFL